MSAKKLMRQQNVSAKRRREQSQAKKKGRQRSR